MLLECTVGVSCEISKWIVAKYGGAPQYFPMTSTESGARGRVLEILKKRGPQRVSELAEQLELTPMGVRQHLTSLEEDGLVGSEEAESSGRGRPARVWALTEEGARRFPESYSDLALELVAGVRDAFGEDGLEQLVRSRLDQQVKSYRALLADRGPELSKRVAALARQRSREGYMAESRSQRDGSVLLIENNCPICAVARVCQGLCGAELELFQKALGRGVSVERTEHMLDGKRRCVYRIEAR